MKRFIPITTIVLLLAFLFSLHASAQPTAAPQHIPAIRNGAQVATVCDGSAPILDQDTGELDVTLDVSGRFIVAYQDRAHGSRIRVDQHIGAGLEPLPAPVALAPAAAVPSFSPAGPKQGPMALVALPNGRVRMYYTQRRFDDETPNEGPYGIWCVEF